MKHQDRIEFKGVINCITGEQQAFSFKVGAKTFIEEVEKDPNVPLFYGPGLIDLQVNGINGIDFNTPSLSQQNLINANRYLLSIGVTTFFPTIITNSDENILRILATVHQACQADELLNSCVGGIHLEGPFISPSEGAKGAHNEKYIKAPDWELFKSFQSAAGERIRIVTLAPEWEGACEFIENCRKENIIVSIGHSLANPEKINNAVNAGATLSTHLGNGVPLMLQRHPNIIWEQLAEEKLYACLIGDGIHVPDSFLKVVMKTKGNRTILVSDATIFSGMLPGEYQNTIGGTVIVDDKKRVSIKNSPGLLAGAGKSLLEDIEYLVQSKVATLGESWQMGSLNVVNMLKENGAMSSDNFDQDQVLFGMHGNDIKVIRTIKNGKTVSDLDSY